MSIADIELAHSSGVYPKRDLTLVRGAGAHVFDESGRRYIDCVAGIGSVNLGHAHPAIVKALTEQSSRLLTCPGIFCNDTRARFLERLVGVASGSTQRVFLCNSGAEAVEGALKFARFSSGRTGVVAAMRGFHGRTLGALSATWERAYREPFEPLVPDFQHIPFNNLEALAAAVTEQTAAVLLEVVQGEGGVRPGTSAFLRGAQALCREHGALFIVDEVQTGFGRTGKMFAYEHQDLDPDLVCLAKSIAGGVPMGAILIGERLGELPKKIHGSTLGGNPLACAAALATLDVLRDEQLPERAARLGAHALARLDAISADVVREARGLGLFLGIELKTRAAPFVRRLQEKGILVLQAGPTVIRILPPLVIEENDLDVVLDTVGQVLAAG